MIFPGIFFSPTQTLALPWDNGRGDYCQLLISKVAVSAPEPSDLLCGYPGVLDLCRRAAGHAELGLGFQNYSINDGKQQLERQARSILKLQNVHTP